MVPVWHLEHGAGAVIRDPHTARTASSLRTCRQPPSPVLDCPDVTMHGIFAHFHSRVLHDTDCVPESASPTRRGLNNYNRVVHRKPPSALQPPFRKTS